MKRWIGWAIALLAVAAIALGVMRAMSARKEQAAAAAAPKVEAPVELAQGDTVVVQQRELSRGLPITGALRAVDSALVKARVAGELRGLTVREGDAVKTGQVLARIDESEYRARVQQMQQQADAARSQIDIAQRQWDNNKALVEQGFISKNALDTSQMTLSGAQATHKAALAATEMARKSLDDTVLRAPISGTVAQRLAQPGERVVVDAKVLEIVDLSRIEMEATLNASDSVQVRVGQTAELQIEGSAAPVKATVARINPTAQAGSRSVPVYLRIDAPAGLRQGLYAQGTLDVGRTSALAVPVSAVRTDKPAPYVQLVEAGKVVHRTVEPGARGTVEGEPLVAIAGSGIAAGTVVLAGQVGVLREGTAVKAAAPAAAAARP